MSQITGSRNKSIATKPIVSIKWNAKNMQLIQNKTEKKEKMIKEKRGQIESQ